MDPLDSSTRRHLFSLSPRERAGVRGKEASDGDADRDSRDACHDLRDSPLADPDQRSNREPFVERHQVRRRQMDAAAGLRTPQRRLIAEAVDVNVALERVDVAPAIEPWLQSF